MMGDFQRVGSSPSRVCSRIQSRSTRSAVTRARTHKIANGDRSLADRAAQLVEVRRPYRLFVESAAARLITNRVALMTRSG